MITAVVGAPTFAIDSTNHATTPTNGNLSPAYTSGWAGVRYTSPDCATYTAANNGGQQFGVYYPGNGTNSVANAKACGYASGIFPYTICFVNFGGFNGSSRTHAFSGSPAIDTTLGHMWQALMANCVCMWLQVTPGGADGTGILPNVTGKGFYHAPGGTARFYEGGTNPAAKNNFNAFTDVQRFIQHIRYFATSRYNIDPEGIIVDGHSSGGCIMAMLGFSPNQAGALGTGGQYDMSTVPNALIVEATCIWDWKRNIQSGGTAFTAAWFPSDETTAAGTVAATLSLAPGGASASTLYDYQREASLSWLCGGVGPDYAPTMLYAGSQQPFDFNFGQPITTGLVPGGTLVHDTGNGFILKGHYRDKVTLSITYYTLSDTAPVTPGTDPPPNQNYADELEGLYDNIGALSLIGDDSVSTGSIDGPGNAGDPNGGFFMAWLNKLKQNKYLLQRWDKVIPDGGIRRQSRVETTGRVIVPFNNSRKQTRFRTAAGGPDIFVGDTQSGAVRRCPAGGEILISGQAPIYAKAEAANASYQLKEEPA